jgi:hypothetical protein
MNKIKNLHAPIAFIYVAVLLSCSPAKKESEPVQEEIRGDTATIISSFITGLWSKDSGNTLTNEGFNFRNDGTVDYVSSEMSGNWELRKDSLKLSWTSWDMAGESIFHIDSLTESRMVLSDTGGSHIYRKVPFGMNQEGNVAQGFSGYIKPGESKEYSFDLPPAKKILVKMTSPDSSVMFRIFDNGNSEITSAPVRNWTGIVIRSGKYRLLLTKPEKSKWKEEADYDIKVVVY